MTYLLFIFYILLELIGYIIFIDVILSWLLLLGFGLRPKFISDILDPLYKNIKAAIPTSIGPIDLTPIVAIIIIYFLQTLLGIIFPETLIHIQQLLN